MSDVEIESDEEGGEIRSEDENNIEVLQEPRDEEIINENTETQEQDAEPQRVEPTIKRVRNPQPKLNADRLKGPRGIKTLEDIFKKIKFQGRGHEEADLNNLMRGYEYWCHRLFPKYTFDDCLDKIERLGSKKEMQTHIKKIRMNLLFLDDANDIIPNDDEDENEVQPPPPTEPDPFDLLLPARNIEVNPPRDLASQTTENQLSEDQLERIRINRERAHRIRLQKMISRQSAASTQNDSNFSVNDISIDQPSSSQPTLNTDDVESQQVIMADKQNDPDAILDSFNVQQISSSQDMEVNDSSEI